MKKFFFVLFLLIIMSIIIKHNQNPSKALKPFPREHVILAFGDSLTYGYGASPTQSYPAILERSIGQKVINAGIPGELSSEGLKRLPFLLTEYRPALLLLCHGGNDILQNKDPEHLKSNLRSMINIARSQNVDVVLIGVPEFSIVFLTSHPLYSEIAKEFEVPIENEILGDVISDNRNKSDQIHPNAQGYALMAKAIEEKLRELYRFEE